MNRELLMAELQRRIAAADERMYVMRADKPNVTDGHSDGKRVRYVRHEQTIATLQAVLSLLEEAGE